MPYASEGERLRFHGLRAAVNAGGGSYIGSNVQVKYEMLRRVRVDKHPVSQSASAFGFSRPTYYQAEADFQRDGVMGLLPEKRGPRQGHKLTSDILDFAARLRAIDPSVRPPALAAAIQKRYAITAHPRSIERALGRHGTARGTLRSRKR